MSPISPATLRALGDASALRALLAALGFRPVAHTLLTAETLGWGESVAVDLRGRAFELLADADDGYFQVLLLLPQAGAAELSADLLRRLFAELDRRQHEAILIQPSRDWASLRLDLLADPRPPTERVDAPVFPSFHLEPRALPPHQIRALELLDVSQAGTGEIAELAGRAFRRAQQERFFRSLNFFSTYYLEGRIATDEAARQPWADLLPAMPALRAALAGADLPAALRALGWDAAPAAPEAPATLAVGGRPVALLAALPEGVALDQAESAAQQAQIALIAALEAAKHTGGVRWGLLTNGRTWRLYSAITSSISGSFYEVELPDLLAFGTDADLRLFAAFFQARSLAEGFPATVFYASQLLSKQVGDSLKDVVFQQVFAELASGIAADLRRQGRYTGDDAQLQLIYRATLVLLYRVLFLLYAESMRLLPVLHTPYYEGSLTRLLTEIALHPFTAGHLRKPLGPSDFWAWEWLRGLFDAVSQGDRARGLPRYNGGLFSDGVGNPSRAAHQLLASVQIGALELHKALDLLGRDATARNSTTADEARRLIDYAALDVRRLGSIYEGLLEFQLAEGAGGALELRQTRQERKASGSYYTPDYIVAYIVQQAVGPVLDERERRFAALMPQISAARTALDRANDKFAAGRTSLATAQAEQQAAAQRLAALEHAASETLLGLKILDPAMGSGHFLVAAVDFVADRLIRILDQHREDNPILARLEAIRSDIRKGLREQGVDVLITDEQLNNVNLLRRLVMKRCVYGVDLNDMAVELARLSLWLNAFTIGAPLSFLDHHLRWGNSLIGARVQAVQQAMEGVETAAGMQVDMFASESAFREMLDFAGSIEQLVNIADANIGQVETSAAIYAGYERDVVPMKRLLDLWVSQSFGSKQATDLITLYGKESEDVKKLKDALAGKATLTHQPWQQAIDHAADLFAQHRFFHWDLEFPEVFIDLQKKDWKRAEEAGFDAVIGNPPYLNAWAMTDLDDSTRQAIVASCKFPSLLEGHWDLYAAFILRSLENVNYYGNHSFIIPDAFAREKYARELRTHILKNTWLKELMHFEGINVFDEVSRHCIIYTITRLPQNQEAITNIVTPISTSNQQLEISSIPQYDWLNGESNQIRVELANPTLREITKKINQQSIKVGQFCYVMVGATVHSKDKKSFTKDTIVSKYPTGNAKKFFDGKDISRYYIHWSGRYIDYRKDEMYGPRVPALFESEKVIVRDITGANEQLIVAYDDQGLYCDHLATCVTYYENVSNFGVQTVFENIARIKPPYPQLKTVTAILASSLLTWLFRETFATGTLQGSYSHTYPQQVRAFPIRRIAFTTPEAERAALVSEGMARYERGLAAGAGQGDWRAWRQRWQPVWDWADARLPRQPDSSPDAAREQSDAIHDLLAHLAERMIALNAQKQAQAAALTAWLEAETGSAIDTWKGKTAVQRFWDSPWEEIARTLQKNRGSFVQTAGMRGKTADTAMEPLLRAAQPRWAQARAAMGPTLAALAATDRLIDLLVYRLYGLSDDEIDLVEGA